MIDHDELPPRASRRLRPKYVLVNYLASLTEPQSGAQIEGTLDDIASDLALDFPMFGEQSIRKELFDDFRHWTERQLIIRADRDPDSWIVPPGMEQNFRAVAEGFNRELDSATVVRVKSAIDAARKRRPARPSIQA